MTHSSFCTRSCASPKSNPCLSTTTFECCLRDPDGSTRLKKLGNLASGERTGPEWSRRGSFRRTSPVDGAANADPPLRSSGRLAPLVSMVKTSDSRTADDRGIATRLRGGRSHRRRALAQPEMRSVVVVVRHELREKSVQVPVPRQYPIRRPAMTFECRLRGSDGSTGLKKLGNLASGQRTGLE